MNAVGIDASKGKSMVTILRPFGEIVSSPHEVKHTSDQIDDLIREIRSLEGDTVFAAHQCLASSEDRHGVHRPLSRTNGSLAF